MKTVQQLIEVLEVRKKSFSAIAKDTETEKALYKIYGRIAEMDFLKLQLMLLLQSQQPDSDIQPQLQQPPC